ncbi:MAG: DUF362 domain-containing protein [Candidatus Berkelbacteria bacterium]|nr:DUF362 domain-containing protein [Candidatus Berkelbacteria bacterium]
MFKVALVHGKNRKSNILKSLQLISDDIKEGLEGKKLVLLKPNIVNTDAPAGATRLETLEVILEFIRPFFPGRIILGEGSGVSDTLDGFKRLGYDSLKDKYNLEFVDLNKDKSREVMVYGKDLKKNFPQHIAETVFEADYIISTALLKTHDSTVVTLGLKNLLVGALQEKWQFGGEKTYHQGYPAMARTLTFLAELYHPSLTVLDGFEAMEGNGPSHGDLVEMKIAISSCDFLAADILAMKLMGFKLDEVGHLKLLAQKNIGESNIEKLEILGETDWKKYIHHMKPHPNYPAQTNWR